MRSARPAAVRLSYFAPLGGAAEVRPLGTASHFHVFSLRLWMRRVVNLRDAVPPVVNPAGKQSNKSNYTG